MKKSLSLILLLLSFAASAKVMDENACRTVAQNFLKGKMGGKVAMEMVGTGTKSVEGTNYFIYNNSIGKGFVIVPAADNVFPILGYSTDSHIVEGRIPDNMQSWLDMWSDIINKMDKDDRYEPEANATWKKLANGPLPQTKSVEKSLQLTTALWDQGDPYNKYCPKQGNELCPTGCTATATCIIMRYHKWPEAGQGVIPSYTSSSGGFSVVIPSITLGQRYDWNNMPLQYKGGETEEQKEQVARLMQHVGAMIQSDYEVNGTGSHPFYVCDAITKFMDYDMSIANLEADNYSSAEWINMLKENLCNVGPALYAGYSSSNGGHAFVLDGYDENNLLHINWGWGGSGNGNYAFPSIGQYTRGQNAIFNMCKNHGGKVGDNVALMQNNQSAGFVTDTDNFESGKSFNVSLDYFVNNGNTAFSGEVGIGKFNAAGELVDVCGSRNVSLEGGYLARITIPGCVFYSSVNIGDYLVPIYRSELTPEWTQLPYNHTAINFTGIIYLSDMYTLGQKTSVLYNRSTKKCTVTTKENATIAFVAEGGATVPEEAYTISGNTLTIDVDKLVKGWYILKLSTDMEYKEIKLKLGLK